MRRLFGDVIFLRLHIAISIILFISLLMNTDNIGRINFIFNTAIICIIDLFLEGSDTDEDNDEDSRVS